MFLKQESPEMDNFEGKKKTLVVKEKYLMIRKYGKNVQVFKHLCKKYSAKNIFAHSFVSEHSTNFFYFEKKLGLFSNAGVDPPSRHVR